MVEWRLAVATTMTEHPAPVVAYFPTEDTDMEPIDPRVHPALLPPGCRALVMAEKQDEYQNLPSIVTDDGRVITRWTLTDAERRALVMGEDLYLTIFGVPIRPVYLSVGPCDWTGVSK